MLVCGVVVAVVAVDNTVGVGVKGAFTVTVFVTAGVVAVVVVVDGSVVVVVDGSVVVGPAVTTVVVDDIVTGVVVVVTVLVGVVVVTAVDVECDVPCLKKSSKDIDTIVFVVGVADGIVVVLELDELAVVVDSGEVVVVGVVTVTVVVVVTAIVAVTVDVVLVASVVVAVAVVVTASTGVCDDGVCTGVCAGVVPVNRRGGTGGVFVNDFNVVLSCDDVRSSVAGV